MLIRPVLAVALAGAVLAGCGKPGRPMPAGGLTAQPPYPPPQAVTLPQKDGRALAPEWDADDLARATQEHRVVVDPSVRQQFIRQTEDITHKRTLIRASDGSMAGDNGTGSRDDLSSSDRTGKQ